MYIDNKSVKSNCCEEFDIFQKMNSKRVKFMFLP